MRPSRPLVFSLFAISIALLSGCAHYEYNIVGPPEARQHVGTKDWGIAETPPVECRFISADNHLVLQIHNRQQAPVRLLGDQSYVDHPSQKPPPLGSQGIAPGCFVKIALPPIPATYRREGPSIGIGIG